MREVTVLRAGPLTTVQDQGRIGHRALGVSRGGALDLFAAQIANLLVGNSVEVALLEVTLGGLRLRFEEARFVAWCGGEFSVEMAGDRIPAGRRSVVRQGEELRVESSGPGCRAWIAIAGEIETPIVLGSRSTDLRSGFGGLKGRALRAGDELSLGACSAPPPKAARVADWGAPEAWSHSALRNPVLRVVRGTEWLEFTAEARADFLNSPFTVSTKADRMGVRLKGVALRRLRNRELLSEAVAPGTVQVAHDGQPILLLGDCQTIGGYPKIGHVVTVDLATAAQLQPNDVVRFQEVSLPDAATLLIERTNELERFRVGLQLHA